MRVSGTSVLISNHKLDATCAFLLLESRQKPLEKIREQPALQF